MLATPAFTTAPVRGFAGLVTVLPHLRTHWQRAKARRWEVTRITRELQGYTDRQLADLGLSRVDIPDVARGTFRAD